MIFRKGLSVGKYYVYVLREPHTEKIFYVGKGCGLRPFDHLKEAEKYKNGSPVSNIEKCKRILSVKSSYGYVKIDIIKRFEDESKAYAYEYNLISLLKDKLTNYKVGNNGLEFCLSKLRKRHIPDAVYRVRLWKNALNIKDRDDPVYLELQQLYEWSVKSLRWWIFVKRLVVKEIQGLTS